MKNENQEFFEALRLLEKEKGVPADYLLEKIKTAIGIAVRRDYGGVDAVFVDIDPETGRFAVSIQKNVVEEIEDEANDILLDEAKRYNKKAIVGQPVEIPLATKDFGRIAAQAAKHVIRQGIREGEREQMLQQFQHKLHEAVTGKVTRIEPTGNVLLEIDGSEVMLFAGEQVPGETFYIGQLVKVYVSDVVANERRCSLKISRTHRELVKRLFEMEVPEIYDGTVLIRSVSREAGSRSKLAVYSNDPQVDAVGACIGPRGARVAAVCEELGGEKIDVIRYSEDPAEFIAQALAPAKVVSVDIIDEEERICRATVPDHQLSLAIGNKGQNAKLAARLTGYKIDIRPESGFYGEDE